MISRKNILELELRKKIHDFIRKNPGLHMRELSRRLNIPKTTLLHHLKFMRKQELITINEIDGYQRIYVTKINGTKEKEILNLLRQKIPRQILLYLVIKTHCSQKELCDALEKSPAVISYHLNKLRKMDLIDAVKINNGIIQRWENPNLFYARIPNKREIIFRAKTVKTNQALYNMFIVYEDSLNDSDIIRSITYLINNLGGFQKIIKTEEAMDNVFNYLYDICPHPYHG